MDSCKPAPLSTLQPPASQQLSAPASQKKSWAAADSLHRPSEVSKQSIGLSSCSPLTSLHNAGSCAKLDFQKILEAPSLRGSHGALRTECLRLRSSAGSASSAGSRSACSACGCQLAALSFESPKTATELFLPPPGPSALSLPPAQLPSPVCENTGELDSGAS